VTLRGILFLLMFVSVLHEKLVNVLVELGMWRLMVKTHNGGQWTPARFNSFIKSALRAASSRWPPKYSALKKATTEKKINWKTGRLAQHYKCASCNNEFPLKEVQVDHITPVIDPSTGFVDWDEVIKRMFCEEDGFQILCQTCHKEKTNVERRQAKENKNK